jgi:tRNA threonylcarbamoyladenosine biosynthesis protein TsaE
MGLLISHSEAETQKIAADFAANLHGGDVILLAGDLGSGKTAFTKGIARALGITKEITSPTFAIMQIYNRDDSPTQDSGSNEEKTNSFQHFVHIDTYRLKSADELLAIGADEYIGAQNSVTIIEWPETIEPLLKNKHSKKIVFQANTDGTRTISIND